MTCTACKGTGEVPDEVPPQLNTLFRRCVQCDGSGTVSGERIAFEVVIQEVSARPSRERRSRHVERVRAGTGGASCCTHHNTPNPMILTDILGILLLGALTACFAFRSVIFEGLRRRR